MVLVLGAIAVLATVWWLGVAVVEGHRARQTPTAELPAYLAHARAVGTIARVLGVALTLAIVFTAPVPETPNPLPTPNPSSSLATLMAAGVVLIVLAVGDRRWPAPTGTVRTASLTARRLRDTVPAAELVVAAAATAILWTRSLLGVTVPWPSTPSSTRIIIDVLSLVGLALAVVTIRHATTRAALVGVDSAADLAFRRMTSGRVLRTVAAAFLISTYGSIEPLLTGDGGSSTWFSSVLLLAGALIALVPLQGRRPRVHATSRASDSARVP